MTGPLPHAVPESDLWDESLWDDVLLHIEEQSVIPIVGPDLLQVEVAGRTELLDRHLARKLAGQLAIPAQDLPGEGQPSLNDVACTHLSRGGRRATLYLRLQAVLKDTPLEPPPALRQLARITHLNLFVTTTFDSLLQAALDGVRFGGAPFTQSLVYSPSKYQDLEIAKSALPYPVVYHLLGKASGSPNYVVSDEDLLEFVIELQRGTRRPERLFDELARNHLLLLGENFSDWLARLFLRTAKGRKLSDSRDVLEVVADGRARADRSLVAFLRHFSSRTHVYGGSATDFVAELSRRWAERHPSSVAGTPPPAPPPREMPPGAIFLSYARDDLAAVQTLKAGLDRAGLVVWFDLEQLQAGDAWEDRIRANVRNCGLFLPVLSASVERRGEAYFRREWHYALDRLKSMAGGRPFLVPVVVDHTREFRTVPERMLEFQVSWLAGGTVTPEFGERVRALVGQLRGSDA